MQPMHIANRNIFYTFLSTVLEKAILQSRFRYKTGLVGTLGALERGLNPFLICCCLAVHEHLWIVMRLDMVLLVKMCYCSHAANGATQSGATELDMPI
jgi:hypothetical protein